MLKGTFSIKAREKIRQSRLGKRWSEDMKLRMSITHKGRKLSEVTKRKLSLLKKNKPWTEAQRKAYERYIPKPKTRPIMKHGKEYDPNWHEIRKEIYKRDNWHCRECGIKTVCVGGESRKVIQCHHIDYNEKNNEPENLITLCASCHGKTRYSKDDWMKYYKNKIEED